MTIIENQFVEFIFHIDPTPKDRPRYSNGRFYTPTKTKNFEELIRVLLSQEWHSPPLLGPLEIKIIFQIKRPLSISPKKRKYPCVKPDLDNLEKSLLDSCNNILWKDDALIVKSTKEKIYGKEGMIVLQVALYP
jgi:Holliday junction resolvase RusA-like endonuclease